MSYIVTKPDIETWTETECINALQNPHLHTVPAGEIVERLAFIQRREAIRDLSRRSGTSKSPSYRPKVPVRPRQNIDVRKVKYASRNTWQELKTKVATGAVTCAGVYDYLDSKGWLPDSIPYNNGISWAVFLAGGSIVVGILIIHLLEERDITIERGP